LLDFDQKFAEILISLYYLVHGLPGCSDSLQTGIFVFQFIIQFLLEDNCFAGDATLDILAGGKSKLWLLVSDLGIE
jgi:hypothetical protein